MKIPMLESGPTASLHSSDAVRCVALAATSLVIALTAYGRWSPASWQFPLEYGLNGYDADAIGILAHVKAAADGYFPPLGSKTVPDLGAPYGANWNDIPIVEQLLYWSTGLIARSISLFPATTAMVVFSHLLSAVCFYCVCRVMRCDWRLAFCGALIFAFARYPFTRQLHHPQVLYDWHIPACLLVIWWLLSKEGLCTRDPRFRWAAAIGVLTGIQHPYYTNMFVQLIVLTCAAQWASGNRQTLRAGFAVVGITMAAFLIMCGNYVLQKLFHGTNAAALVRSYHWLEFYALKPLDLFMPPPDHRLSAFAALSQRYYKGVLTSGEVPPSTYLGLVGIVALFVLVFVAGRALIRQRSAGVPAEAWQVLWIVLYSVVGGVNGLLGVLGIELFRSANRYSIFILAIVLLYGIRRLSDSLLASRRLQTLTWPICVVTLVLALWDQIPPLPQSATAARIADAVDADREFAEAMEARLPERAMVFQLPVMQYPESPAPGMPAYDHFRPYLYTHRLRYSFGGCKGRPAADWPMALAQRDVPIVVRELERFGFSALYINRAGFPDQGKQLLKSLDEMGLPAALVSRRSDLVMVPLKPSETPALPLSGKNSQ